MEKQKVTPVLKDTYLAMIKNSLGTNMFRNLVAEIDGQKKDITENGNLSCAFYVSSLLYLFKLISGVHATVSGTQRDLENSGWQKIEEPKDGAILIWTEKDFGDDQKHKHIGFYIDGKAISNSSENGSPKEHDWQTFDGRKLESIFWHSKLD